MTSKTFTQYIPHLFVGAAICAAIVVPQEVRSAAWAWLLKGLSVMDVLLIVGGFRVMSNVEHRKTLMKIAGIGEQLDNGIKERLARIEKQLMERGDV